MRVLAVALAAVAVVASCSSDDRASPATLAPAPATTAAAVTGAVPAALDFSAPTVGGGELDLRTYAGRNLALWFWAPY
jgi:hypothetical protein